MSFDEPSIALWKLFIVCNAVEVRFKELVGYRILKRGCRKHQPICSVNRAQLSRPTTKKTSIHSVDFKELAFCVNIIIIVINIIIMYFRLFSWIPRIRRLKTKYQDLHKWKLMFLHAFI